MKWQLWRKWRFSAITGSLIILGLVVAVVSGLFAPAVQAWMLLAGAIFCLAGGLLALGWVVRRIFRREISAAGGKSNPGMLYLWIYLLALLLPWAWVGFFSLAGLFLQTNPEGFSAWRGPQGLLLPAAQGGAPMLSPFAFYQILFLGLLGYLYLWRKEKIHFERPSFWLMALALLSGLGLWLVAFFLQGLINSLVPEIWHTWFPPMQVHPENRPWLNCLMLAGVAPLVEEWFYRRGLLPELLPRLGETGALLVCAAAGAAFWLNPVIFLPLMLVHYGLGWLALRSGRIWPVWLAHTLFNLMLVL